ncbi:AAA family ATPase [Paenibacillus sp. MMS18-CY102]|uniref:AAA family ATPase n=1 Tax=Paenibacillus sp. MMS18-CY102 TaxID=2682849 RepID=UPI0013652C3E|nr:ATP-binding protein [Paenibacillus sp. MMS18-CY102]MWC27575.1 AAA family ATPase [Paenibacillus sp. MMS18-CY102]
MARDAVIEQLVERLREPAAFVAMMCGVAGSGKTTFAQQIEKAGYIRLSIDEEIWSANGRYGIDYSPDDYEQLKSAAEAKLRKELITHVRNQRCVVVDFSFWARKRRDEYKRIIEEAGGRWALIYLKVRPEELRERLRIRSERFDANAAFPITEEILSSYLSGFEQPIGEGEIVIDEP